MLTNNELHAIGNQFPGLVKHLEEMLESHKNNLVKVGDVDVLKRTQGKAQCLQELIGHLAPASPARKGSTT